MESKKTEKENYVKKYFPLCCSSPGGTLKLVSYPTDVPSAGNRRVEKMSACTSRNYSAIKFNFNNVKNIFTIDSRTVTHNIVKEESL